MMQGQGLSGAVAMRIYQAMKEMVAGGRAGHSRPARAADPVRALRNLEHALRPKVRGRLETISIRIHHLRAAQRARAGEDVKVHASALGALAGEWLEETAVS